MVKKALLIGINYIGQNGELNGCINDVHNVSDLLQNKFGYHKIVKLVEEDNYSHPTRDNILSHMNWLCSDAKAGDHLFFHYSGHGSSVRDTNSDELDGRDEVIVPLDYQNSDVIPDDLLRRLLIDTLPDGVTMTIIMDCCHSGSIIDLRYQFNDKSYKVGLELDTYDSDDERTILYSNFTDLLTKYYNKDFRYRDYIRVTEITENPKYPVSKCDVTVISGCMDDQTSADAFINSSYQGALTNAFLNVMSSNNCHINKKNLLKGMRLFLLENEYTQIPQMSSGKPINLSDDYSL